jgi:predicted transcriptional regulator YdeE
MIRKKGGSNMIEYEVVNLQEKKLVGITARTNNLSTEMSNIIGGLWTRFYSEGIYEEIPKKVSGKSLGTYTDFAGDATGDYTAGVAVEVSSFDSVPDTLETYTIPSGKYAKFIVNGNVHTAVAEFWQKIWEEGFSKNYMCDFEEYQTSDMDHAVIHIYISID